VGVAVETRLVPFPVLQKRWCERFWYFFATFINVLQRESSIFEISSLSGFPVFSSSHELKVELVTI